MLWEAGRTCNIMQQYKGGMEFNVSWRRTRSFMTFGWFCAVPCFQFGKTHPLKQIKAKKGSAWLARSERFVLPKIISAKGFAGNWWNESEMRGSVIQMKTCGPISKDFQECFDPRAVGWGREPMRAAFFAYENEERPQVAKASRHVRGIAES